MKRDAALASDGTPNRSNRSAKAASARLSILMCIVGLCFTHGANAAFQRFDFLWGGAGQPLVTGHIVFDTAVLPNTSLAVPALDIGVSLPSPAVKELTITVTGSVNGDGTYDIKKFSEVYLWVPGGGLDFTRELVGQTMGSGWVFGDSPPLDQYGPSGDFGVWANDLSPKTPRSATWYYYLTIGDQSSECCQTARLVSMRPVPETNTAAMMGIGVAVLLLTTLGRSRCRD